jgi:hypothetical protein
MSDLTNKDAEQDTKIAVMDSTLENAIRRIEMVHSRIDKTEEQIKELKKQVIDNKIWIQRASAVIGAAVALIGIIVALPQDADSKELKNGSNDTTQQEIVLHIPGDRN